MDEFVDEFVAIVERHKLRDVEVAALTGLSIPTVRILRRARIIPQQERCIEALRSFVLHNGAAATRDSLRLPERTAA